GPRVQVAVGERPGLAVPAVASAEAERYPRRDAGGPDQPGHRGRVLLAEALLVVEEVDDRATARPALRLQAVPEAVFDGEVVWDRADLVVRGLLAIDDRRQLRVDLSDPRPRHRRVLPLDRFVRVQRLGGAQRLGAVLGVHVIEAVPLAADVAAPRVDQ